MVESWRATVEASNLSPQSKRNYIGKVDLFVWASPIEMDSRPTIGLIETMAKRHVETIKRDRTKRGTDLVHYVLNRFIEHVAAQTHQRGSIFQMNATDEMFDAFKSRIEMLIQLAKYQPRYRRNLLMVGLSFEFNLKPGEVFHLGIGDISLSRGSIISGNGKTYPIHPFIGRLIERWGSHHFGEGMWINLNRFRGSNHQLKRSTFIRIFRMTARSNWVRMGQIRNRLLIDLEPYETSSRAIDDWFSTLEGKQ